jgi:hypothetical protein
MSSSPAPAVSAEPDDLALRSAVKHACSLLDAAPFLEEVQLTYRGGAASGPVTKRFTRSPEGNGQIDVRTGPATLPEVVAAIAGAMAKQGPASAYLTVGDVGVHITRPEIHT